MKIIGKTEKNWIVVMSGDELVKIAGYTYTSEKNAPSPSVGMVITMSELWHKLQAFKSCASEIKAAQEKLLKAVKALDPVQVQIDRIEKE